MPEQVTSAAERPAGLRPTNLPIPLTSFIGRDQEIAEVKRLLSDSRLVTLTGPGGCGKTRLAIHVAGEALGNFPDGVWLVELASLADPALVPPVVATALGVREDQGRPPAATLVDHLRAKSALLMLDNYEHLIEACAELAETLLRACPKLRVLATSREALNIAGEQAWIVPSLSLPETHQQPPVEELRRYDGIRLFVDRAATARPMPRFTLTAENAVDVQQICRRLDGIPLAIELAAARAKTLTVDQIAARLADRFHLLTAGRRTELPRHQTLRALIDWSYDLLSEAERALLRRLTVFAGGWTLEAAEAVCAGGVVEADGVLDLLSHLVDKSLVAMQERDGEARYRMLETVREYAREKLTGAVEEEGVRDRHLEFFLSLAEEAEPYLFGRGQVAGLNRLEADIDNLRAAIEWSLTRAPVTAALRLVGALWWFWQARGYNEGLNRTLQVVSSAAARQPSVERAKALNVAGHFLWGRGDLAEAQALLLEALATGREAASQINVAWSLQFLALVAISQGNYGAARSYFDEGLAIAHDLGATDTYAIGEWLAFRGEVALHEGDYERARSLYEEGAARLREFGDKSFLAYPVRRLGLMALHRGDLAAAAALCTESLLLNVETREEWGIAASLVGLAGVALSRGYVARAARLLGAVDAVVEAIVVPLLYSDRLEYDRNLAAVRARLDRADFAAAWAEGRAMTLEQAAAYALGDSVETGR